MMFRQRSQEFGSVIRHYPFCLETLCASHIATCKGIQIVSTTTQDIVRMANAIAHYKLQVLEAPKSLKATQDLISIKLQRKYVSKLPSKKENCRNKRRVFISMLFLCIFL